MIRYIWIIHISPETNGTGEILPHTLVFPYTFLTFVNKWLQTILLDLILAVQTKRFLDLKLNRQTVRIPAGLSRNLVALHCAVSRNHILDNTGQYVTDVRLAICSRRTVVECVNVIAVTLFHALFEDVILFPELFCCLLSVNKIQIR